MMKLAPLALLLGGCASQPVDAFRNLVVGESHAEYAGPSQAPDMQAVGLRPVTYVLGMALVPCMGYDGINHIPLTVAQRVAYLRAEGGYMADCGEHDDLHVWGLPV